MRNLGHQICYLPVVAATISGSTALADTPSIEDSQRLVAQILAKQLPRKIDESTTLLTAFAQGAMLIYSYRVDIDANQVTQEGKQLFNLTIMKNVCVNPQMRRTMADGAKYMYLHKDKADVLFNQLTVDSGVCSILETSPGSPALGITKAP